MNLNQFKKFENATSLNSKRALLSLALEILEKRQSQLEIARSILNSENPDENSIQLLDEIDLDRASFMLDKASFMKVMNILELAVKGCDNL